MGLYCIVPVRIEIHVGLVGTNAFIELTKNEHLSTYACFCYHEYVFGKPSRRSRKTRNVKNIEKCRNMFVYIDTHNAFREM